MLIGVAGVEAKYIWKALFLKCVPFLQTEIWSFCINTVHLLCLVLLFTKQNWFPPASHEMNCNASIFFFVFFNIWVLALRKIEVLSKIKNQISISSHNFKIWCVWFSEIIRKKTVSSWQMQKPQSINKTKIIIKGNNIVEGNLVIDFFHYFDENILNMKWVLKSC